MNIYKVSCYSKCGSYFASYLKSVTVVADTEEQAKEVVKKWLQDEGSSFIYPESEWVVGKLSEFKPNTVIDFDESADY